MMTPTLPDHGGPPRLAKAAVPAVESFIQRLRRERGFLERVLNALTEGVIVTGADLRVLLCNDRGRELLGLAEGRRVHGLHLMDIVKYPELRSLILRLDLGGRRAVNEEIPVGGGGRPLATLRVGVVPLPASGSTPGDVVFILQDTSEEHRLEEARRHTEKLASLATLTAGIAHEIKNPLNSLSIHAQLLDKRVAAADARGDESLDTEDLRESLHVIREEIDRLGHIVDEFLQAVRPTSPWMEPRPLNAMLERIAELVRPQCEQHGIALRFLPDSELKLVQYDEHQLGRAVLNLLKNAYEAVIERQERAERTDEPRPDAEVTLRTRLSGDRAIISVADTGVGIPEEHLPRLFDPYFTTKFHGTGLGLMNVHRIVKEHDGELQLETQPGVGTTFTIAIPLRAPLPVRRIEAPAP